MPIETIMPCLGEVAASVKSFEITPRKSCTCLEQESGRIYSSDSHWQVDFEIGYEGVLFDLIDSSNSWNIEVWLENIGGGHDDNYQVKETIPHVQSAGSTTIDGMIGLDRGNLTPGAIYRQVFKVELNVGGNLLVCAFSEGKSIYVSSA